MAFFRFPFLASWEPVARIAREQALTNWLTSSFDSAKVLGYLSARQAPRRHPQLPPQFQRHFPFRQSFSRLCAVQIRLHSHRQLAKPRKWKSSIPMAPLIWPKTGSTIRDRF